QPELGGAGPLQQPPCPRSVGPGVGAGRHPGPVHGQPPRVCDRPGGPAQGAVGPRQRQFSLPQRRTAPCARPQRRRGGDLRQSPGWGDGGHRRRPHQGAAVPGGGRGRPTPGAGGAGFCPVAGGGGHRAAQPGLGRRRPVVYLHRRHHGLPQGGDDPPGRAVSQPGSEQHFHHLWRTSGEPGGAPGAGCRTPAAAPAHPGVRPLMHAVGLYSTLFPLSYGVGVVLMAGAHFDPLAVLDAVARYAITRFAIVGDAMGVPLVEALRAHPGRWHLEGLEGISSAGMALSRDTKRGLLEALPWLSISDGLGASESPGMAFQVVTRENLGAAADATLALPPTCKVLRGDLSGEVTPGRGGVGLFAKCGLLAEAYYKDPEATATTFPVIAGTRYVVPGDWAEVLADGRVRFVGRGALCLNSGGEKVYVEEVEAAVRTHRDVADVA